MTSKSSWPFAEPEHVAVFTTRHILDGEAPILHITHDADDGAWQFLPGFGVCTDDARVVSLRSILSLDATLAELADLPLGWQAVRATKSEPWRRRPRNEG